MTKLLHNTYLFLFKKHPYWTIAFVFLVVGAYYFCLPKPLFTDPTCMVLTDKEEQLLGAKIATDGQWRFPHQSYVSPKFTAAITTFEDKRFFSHIGVDPIGIGRAFYQNLQAGTIKSGGSTLSMQVIRLSRKGKPRTIYQKIIEILLATRLEWSYSKEQILSLYASNAPFGGNIVGLETASWRYYGKQPHLLTWAENATLAVLPNSPALIHPGRNRSALLRKRNRLLNRLYQKGLLDELSWELAKEEALPNKPLPLPRLAPHLLERAVQEHRQVATTTLPKITTSIKADLQKNAQQILLKHHQHLKGNDVQNAAAIIIDVATGEAVAYIGNIPQEKAIHGSDVDIITASRSTGSILKPFLYAGLLQSGQLLPNSLVPDVPTQMNGYQPKNFHETYDGVVPAKQALIRSLNIPFIRLLQDYGLEKFHFLLKQLGLTTLQHPANHYGLPLILGGAEGSLWDITNAYACMARTLNHFTDNSGQYQPQDFNPPTYQAVSNAAHTQWIAEPPILSAAAIYYTFEAMRKVERPTLEGNWEQFTASQQIAWKTGTSIGFRDAWAIGVTPKYAIGVWVGNADGEGRAGLTGITTAAPILFDLLDLLPTTPWFAPPYDEFVSIATCKKSGFRALEICEADTISVTLMGLKVAACPYHQLVHLDQSQTWQVTSQCANPIEMIHQPWFVLPPGEAYYYRFRSPTYQSLPPFKAGCSTDASLQQPMQIIYPKTNKQIYVPIDINGESSRTVFKVAHRKASAIVYWHIDDTYLGSTQTFHQMELNPTAGSHTLAVVDEQGHRLEQRFEIVRE